MWGAWYRKKPRKKTFYWSDLLFPDFLLFRFFVGRVYVLYMLFLLAIRVKTQLLLSDSQYLLKKGDLLCMRRFKSFYLDAASSFRTCFMMCIRGDIRGPIHQPLVYFLTVSLTVAMVAPWPRTWAFAPCSGDDSADTAA